jgi:hypothetical protein
MEPKNTFNSNGLRGVNAGRCAGPQRQMAVND